MCYKGKLLLGYAIAQYQPQSLSGVSRQGFCHNCCNNSSGYACIREVISQPRHTRGLLIKYVDTPSSSAHRALPCALAMQSELLCVPVYVCLDSWLLQLSIRPVPCIAAETSHNLCTIIKVLVGQRGLGSARLWLIAFSCVQGKLVWW